MNSCMNIIHLFEKTPQSCLGWPAFFLAAGIPGGIQPETNQIIQGNSWKHSFVQIDENRLTS